MTNQQIKNITLESLRDWFKKEKWVRITTSGNIAGPCGTSKNKKNPDRCLPRAKAQSLTKAQRAATARKKKKAGAKGKTVVKNTKKATVRKEDYSPLDFKYKKGFKDLTGLFKKITSSSDIETIKKLSHVFVDNLKKASKIQRARYKKDIQNGNKSSIFSLITNLYMNDNRMTSGLRRETKGAPKGHYFTASGNLVKGRLTKAAREKGARLSDPKDKQRSKVPPVTQYNELELPQAALTRINNDVKNAKTMAQSILQYIDAVDDKEQPAIFKNPKLRRAIELLKDLGDDEPTQEPANETANPQDGKAAPFGSGFKKVNEMTIEDIKNLTVGLLHEIQGKEVLMEKDDRCTRIAKRKYDTWPSAYASGAVVRCRRGEIWKGQK